MGGWVAGRLGGWQRGWLGGWQGGRLAGRLGGWQGGNLDRLARGARESNEATMLAERQAGRLAGRVAGRQRGWLVTLMASPVARARAWPASTSSSILPITTVTFASRLCTGLTV